MTRRADSSKRHEPLTFFVDRDLGPLATSDVVRALRERGVSVENHAAHYPEDGPMPPDHEWIGLCARNRWVGITKDARCGFQELAQREIMTNGGRLIVCIARKYTHAEIAENIANSVENIERFVHKHKDSFIARLYMPSEQARKRQKGGDVTMWRSYDMWFEAQAKRGLTMNRPAD